MTGGAAVPFDLLQRVKDLLGIDVLLDLLGGLFVDRHVELLGDPVDDRGDLGQFVLGQQADMQGEVVAGVGALLLAPLVHQHEQRQEDRLGRRDRADQPDAVGEGDRDRDQVRQDQQRPAVEGDVQQDEAHRAGDAGDPFGDPVAQRGAGVLLPAAPDQAHDVAGQLLVHAFPGRDGVLGVHDSLSTFAIHKGRGRDPVPVPHIVTDDCR